MKFETDADLELGVFGIATRLARRAARSTRDEPSSEAAPSATMIYTPPALPANPV